ncbi:MAG: ATP-binding protein [Bacteroidia bacterium]|nr:ATP-binding protein [Bacteroidia bacterium]
MLKSTVIYGANASGKTNLIRAFEFMRNVVAESAGLQQGQKLNFQPFKLDKETINQPSEFEITFLDSGIRYQYGFALTAERITEEWLLVYKKAKPQEWFTRNYNEKNKQDTYKLGPHLKGSKKLWSGLHKTKCSFPFNCSPT